MTLHHGVSLEATDRRPTVLLVDDDEVNLLMTAAALRDRGFDITSTTGGEEALTRLASWTPDVVVLDAIMPGLDGFETCVALRNMPGFDHVPVLMLTGLDDEASINRAYQVGATDFFVKATQWSLLAGRLRYLLRASRTRQELERSKAKLARAQDLARLSLDAGRRRAAGRERPRPDRQRPLAEFQGRGGRQGCHGAAWRQQSRQADRAEREGRRHQRPRRYAKPP